MGLCNSKMDQSDLEGQGSSSKRSQKQALLKTGRGQNYIDGLVPSTLEEIKRTEPDQGQLRIKTQETKQVVDETARHVAEHPVYQQHGRDVYSLHALLEDIYGLTYYPVSLERNASLKLLESQIDQDTFTLDGSEDQIEKILEHQGCHNQYPAKLSYLYGVYSRLQANNQPSVINHDQKDKLKTIIFSHLIITSRSPGFDNGRGRTMDCDSESILRIKFYSPCHDALYTQLASLNKDFIADFLANVKTQDLNEVLTPLFKTIIRDCNNSTIHDPKKLLEGIEVLDALLQADNRVIDCFVNHELYIPKIAILDGAYFQKFSMFGACLSLKTFTDEVDQIPPIVQSFGLFDPTGTINTMRTHLHKAIFGVHKIMEYMIKSNQKYEQNILDWCYQALVLNDNKKMMLDPNADPNSTTKVSSQSWFTNYLMLLLRFSQDFLGNTEEYPHLCTRIQRHFLQERQLFQDCILLSNKQNVSALAEEQKSEETDRLIENSQGSNSKDTFITGLVFFTSHALLLHIFANRKYVFIIERMAELASQGNLFQVVFANHSRLCHDVQLGDPYLYEQIHKFLAFQVLLILHSCDIPIQDLSMIDKAFEQTARIKIADIENKCLSPLYWVENIHEYLLAIRKIEHSVFLASPKNSEILMNFTLIMIKNPDWIGIPMLKVYYLEFLGTVFPRKKPMMHDMDDKDPEIFAALFLNNRFYKNYLIEGLINVFVEIEKIIPSHQFWDRIKYQIVCCGILNQLLGTSTALNKVIQVAESLEKLTRQGDDGFAKFIVHYMDDIIQMLDYYIVQLQEVKIYHENSNGLAQEGDIAQKYAHNKSELNASSITLKVYYETAIHMTKVLPKFLLSLTSKDKFIANLNESLKKLNGDSVTISKVVSDDITLSHPRFFMAILVQIYLNFVDKRDFLKSIAQDEGNFNIEFFHTTYKTLKKHSMLNFRQKSSFKTFLSQLKKEVLEKNKETKLMSKISDIPEEFRDPITNEVMKDPVLIPTCKQVVERAVILRHLLNHDTDPFTRIPLTKEMLVPQPELKKRIEDFFSGERARLIKAEPKKKFTLF